MRGIVQSPKITALRGIEGSHLSVTPQLSAEPPPSCTGPGGGTLGSSEVEVVVEGDKEACRLTAGGRRPWTSSGRGLPDRLQPRQVEGEGGSAGAPQLSRGGERR